MNINSFTFRIVVLIFLLGTASSHAVVFTNNTSIGALDASYDGADIVISNCTVTLDGAHGFNSVLVANGGVLTHTFYPNGSTTFLVGVGNEAIVLSSTNPAVLLHTNVASIATVTDLAQVTTYANNVDYVLAPQPDGTTQLWWTNTSAIADGATVLVNYTWAYNVMAGLNVTVTNDFTVAIGGSVNATGNGYGGGLGSGHGFTAASSFADGSGAGYGGNGGNSSSNAVGGAGYGSLTQPNLPGSGGGASYLGSGGHGGGLVQIVAGRNVMVDGAILANGANGTNSRAGGGAGGSIWITAPNLAGAGTLTANGGAGEPVHGGGGGGGRIAIQCGTNYFTGTLTTYGGSGAKIGGAGTIFLQVTNQNGFLLVDNGGRAGNYSTVILPALTDVLIRSNATVFPSGAWSAGNVTIGKAGTLAQATLNLNVTGTLAVQTGGAISADGLGYTSGSGPGAGRFYSASPFYPCSGAGHGGNGALGSPTNINANAGGTYGSQTSLNSSDFGSGGGTYATFSLGGNGGGFLNLSVNGALQVDGTISANGTSGFGTGGGGGSGGGIAITATTLTGNGAILANGGSGAGTAGGGGGGGRITVNSVSNLFSGTLLAAGGGGANYGGAGTIYLQRPSVSSYQLILDNGGHAGTNTPVSSASTASLIVRNGAVGSANFSASFAGLNIFSNSWLASIGQTVPSTLTLAISGDATIQAGGGIIGDSFGYTANTGIGGGAGGFSSGYPPFSSNGGGHGGAGGFGAPLALTTSPGTINDNVATPTYAGSGGGGNGGGSLGGRGGSFIQLTVNGRLQLDGLISANGGNGSGSGGGGGAGGSLYLTASILSGSGAIRANGGNGVDVIGGGGGGGCIALYFNTNNFSGPSTAYGGSGYNYGGAGTIFLKKNSENRASLIVDNGGHAGANSATLSSSSYLGTDITLQNGALVFANSSLSVGNLLIGSNSWIIVTNGTSVANWILNASGNVTVQAGGGISADAAGYRQGQGTGAGGTYGSSPYYPSGGGGHAGYGGNSTNSSGFIGGGGSAGFDTITSPTLAGSGGGYNSTFSFGGNGGGVIQMNITGNLQVDGALSANGGSGSGTGGGGGAGGSVNLSVGNLLGSGVISVNGGNGVGGVGGGGGGGNIACSFTSNLFSGIFSAAGGGGANYGGAGLIYIKTNTSTIATLIADNAGHRSTNTPVSPLASSSALIIRNGAIVVPASQSQSIASLLITSNAWFQPGNYNFGVLIFTVNGNATLQSGGGILADAIGSSPGNGSGRGFNYGSSPYYQCSGAAHGGFGAAGISNSFNPIFSPTYDSTTLPTQLGSGGGGFTGSSSGSGGYGGGYVNFRVNGALQLDGIISANGGNGSGGGGGGSGGSLNLNFGSLAGSGSITANGGNGAGNIGGGGGGGRIAIYFNTNNFAGAVTTFGGGGANYGGAGTIYYKTNSQPYGQLVLDNNNNAGTNSAFDFLIMDVTIQNRAIGQLPVSGSWSAHNILIRTNGTLTGIASSSSRNLTVNTLTIDAGGALSLDGAGYASSVGPGNAAYGGLGNIRGGAGHGGFGGGNAINFGKAYDSIISPATPGSGGGGYSSGNGGGGGGALSLSVVPLGTLTVNGRLSANGANGDYGAGGGSGGSLYFPFLNKLSGNGVISANGGAATGTAGGGGGGRIAFNTVVSNNFSGQITAFGGSGIFPGGAGTIYSRGTTTKTLLVDNGGLNGTNTPLGNSFGMPSPPFDLNISGAAVVVPFTQLPLINNLNLAVGSTFTVPAARSNLFIAVLKNANLAGSVTVDNLGYAQANGPGAGTTIASKGSGAGYGGAGGNAANGAVGGTSYGSAAQPVDFGSGGGSGIISLTGGSEGGGAVRMSVGGNLNIDGNFSANGDYGWQDDSGGGSGGSIYISANSVSGAGTLSAYGGNGDLWNGGGGGGGRIAIYSLTNLFAGYTNVSGGFGAANGSPGTVFLSGTFANFFALAQSPTGTVNNIVSYVDVSFNDAVDPSSVSSAAFTITTPTGVIDSASVTASAVDATTVRVSFPVQNLNGNYSLAVTSGVANIFGGPLAQSFTGNFTIAVPTISGTVSDINGAPAAGVTIQPDITLPAIVTDTNGNYSLGVPPGWNGNLTASLGTNIFVPRILACTNVTTSLTNQNFLMVSTVTPTLTSSSTSTNFTMAWQGIPNVTYSVVYSADLVNWTAYGGTGLSLLGTNGPMQVTLPIDSSPMLFFRLNCSY